MKYRIVDTTDHANIGYVFERPKIKDSLKLPSGLVMDIQEITERNEILTISNFNYAIVAKLDK